jgi:hypothetical protein
MFLMIFRASNAPRGGFNIYFDTKNKRPFPLDLNYLKCLNVIKPA